MVMHWPTLSLKCGIYNLCPHLLDSASETWKLSWNWLYIALHEDKSWWWIWQVYFYSCSIASFLICCNSSPNMYVTSLFICFYGCIFFFERKAMALLDWALVYNLTIPNISLIDEGIEEYIHLPNSLADFLFNTCWFSFI